MTFVPAGPSPPRATVRALAVVALSGAWLPIVFSSAVLLPQRVEQLAAGPRWSATYAALSAAGWLTVIVGLTLSGHLRDSGRMPSARDARTIRLIALAVLATGAALPLADHVMTLGALWILALLPASFGVTLLASRVAEESAIASASAIGSAPLLAVFIGALAVTIVPVAGAGRFLLIASVSAAVMLGATVDPGASARASDERPKAPPEPTSLRGAARETEHAAAVRDSIGRNRRLLIAVTLVDTGTVTLTFAIVPLVFLLPQSGGPTAMDATPGAYAERLVLLATVVSILAVWLAPHVGVVGSPTRRLFTVSAAMTAVALVTAPLANARALLGVAMLSGLAIGASNAATFGLFLGDPTSTTQRATGLGLLNAAPSIPAALVPMLAVPLLRWSPEQGLLVLMIGAAVLAAGGAIAAPADGGTALSRRRATRRGRGARPGRR